MPAVEATLSTAPAPRRTIAGTNAEVSATGASTSTRSCSRSGPGSASANGPPVAKPALLTSTEISSSSASMRAGSRLREASLVRSQPTPTARTPNCAVSWAASSSSLGLRRATSTSECPRRASSRAIAAPIPAEAPVTSAALPGVGSGRLIGLRRSVPATPWARPPERGEITLHGVPWARERRRLERMSTEAASADAPAQPARPDGGAETPGATGTALLFPGQGSQTPEMRELVAAERPDLLELAVDTVGEDPFPRADDGTNFAQPAIFCASLAGWASIGSPVTGLMAGHSLGELGALVAAGVLQERDALSLGT